MHSAKRQKTQSASSISSSSTTRQSCDNSKMLRLDLEEDSPRQRKEQEVALAMACSSKYGCKFEGSTVTFKVGKLRDKFNVHRVLLTERAANLNELYLADSNCSKVLLRYEDKQIFLNFVEWLYTDDYFNPWRPRTGMRCISLNGEPYTSSFPGESPCQGRANTRPLPPYKQLDYDVSPYGQSYQRFTSLQYPGKAPQLPPRLARHERTMDLSEVLYVHWGTYDFAKRHKLPLLQRRAWYKLQDMLCTIGLLDNELTEIVILIKFVDQFKDYQKGDPVRLLFLEYAVLNLARLLRLDAFRSLLASQPQWSIDVFDLAAERGIPSSPLVHDSHPSRTANPSSVVSGIEV